MADAPASRAVVVTGASTGIGRACALRLSRLGFRVFAGVRREEDARALEEEATGLASLRLDVTDRNSIEAAARAVEAEVGESGLAGLVNNAGIVTVGPLEFLPLDAFREQLEVNVVGQLAVTQALLPLLRRARGRIVNMGSIADRISSPFLGAYSASKFALAALNDALRRELAAAGIAVVLVEPGSVATPIWQKSGVAAEEIRRELPERARELYGPGYEAIRRAAARSAAEGVPADAVAEVVASALTARRPRTRYVIGPRTGRKALLARLLPDRLLDVAIARSLGLSKGT